MRVTVQAGLRMGRLRTHGNGNERDRESGFPVEFYLRYVYNDRNKGETVSGTVRHAML